MLYICVYFLFISRERKVDFNEAKQASAQSQAAALADKPLTKAHGLAQHAQHALAVIHKQKLSKEDQDMVRKHVCW